MNALLVPIAPTLDPEGLRPPAADIAIEIARIAMQFARVDRITQHPDGHPESDTDHTVMLALLAGELCPPTLSRTLVVSYAVVHDLVETYAGDTPTLRLPSIEQAAAKDAREADALLRIHRELGPNSWIVDTICRYERQADPESRWVKALDKCAPKLTHIFNGCAAIRAQGVTLAEVIERVEGQIARIGDDLPEARQLASDLLARVVAAWPKEGA